LSSVDGEVFMVMTELLPELQKYQDLKPKFIKIKVEKYSDGTVIKIKSDEKLVSEALGNIMLLMAKFGSNECKIETQVEDKSYV